MPLPAPPPLPAPRSLRAPLACVVGCALVALATPASASTLILVQGATDDDGLERARALIAERVGYPAEELRRVEPLQTFLFDGAELWPTTGAPRACVDGPRSDLEGALLVAEEAVDALEFDRARDDLAALTDGLACFEAGVTRDRLSRAALLLGYARFQLGDRDGAREAFGMAAVFDPQVEWDDTYPPDAQQVFNNAVLASLRAEPVWVRGQTDAITVDGAALTAGAELRPGRHLLTVPHEGGRPRAIEVTLEPGRTVHLVGTERLADDLLDGGKGRALAAARLGEQLAAVGDPETFLVDEGYGRAYRFTGGDGVLLELPALVAAGDEPDDPVRRPAPRAGGGRAVMSRGTRAALGITGTGLLLAGMGVSVGTGFLYASDCAHTTGNLPALGLIPFAGAPVLHQLWLQNFGRDCYDAVARYTALPIVLSVVEGIGAALLIAALIARPDDGPTARSSRRRGDRPAVLVLPSLSPRGDAALTVSLRF